MNNISGISVALAIGVGFVLTLIGIFVKAVMDAHKFQVERDERGEELFRLFFVGPDLISLALGLLVSSKVIELIFNGRNVTHNFGENFGNWFYLLFLIHIVCYFACILFWHAHSQTARRLLITEREGTRQTKGGKEKKQKEYIVDWQASFKTSASIWILILGNFMGLFSLVAYGSFIFFGFVRKF